MATIIAEDKTGRIDVIAFPKIWKKFSDIICEDDVAMVTCKVQKDTFDEEKSITKLILLKYTLIDDYGEIVDSEVSDLKVSMKDGAMVKFIVLKNTKLAMWQKAAAIASNLERTI